MGNCWPKPVESLPSAPKPASPAAETRDHQHKGGKTRGSISTVNFVGLDVEHNNDFPPDDHQRRVVVVVKDSKEGGVDHHRRDHDHDQDVAAAEAPSTTAGTCSSSSSSTSSTGPGSGHIMAAPNLKMFTYSELRSATRNFRPDTVLGEGGFGRVFRGWVDEKSYAPSKVGVGIPVAVKKSNPDSEQGLSEWQAEVKFLGKFCHPNLVKLLGYCWEDREFLLVYEYMQRGSLESHLFRKGAETLAWETRLKIAIGAARGLAFLHTTEKQVIYRDFKASNILLDSDFNAKLSDFGLAKLGPVNGYSHVTTRVVGTYGYAAPEYMATGHLYVKSDVYGFGVVLLEIISGLRVLDLNRPSGEHNLVDWSKPLLPEKRKLRKVMDPQLEGRYPSRGAFQIAQLILKCLEPDPKKRPPMEQVLETLQQISTVKMKPKDAKAAAQQHQAEQHQHQHQHQHQQPLRRPANRTPHRSPLHTKHSSCSSVIGARAQHKDKHSY